MSRKVDGVPSEWLENYAGLLAENFMPDAADKVCEFLAAPIVEADGMGEAVTRIRLVRAETLVEVERILAGIDKTETESPDGWWETSTGADFGSGKLKIIRALLSVIRVKDFGAQGDGVTDDGEAFQEAVRHAKSVAPSPEWLDLLRKDLRDGIRAARQELSKEGFRFSVISPALGAPLGCTHLSVDPKCKSTAGVQYYKRKSDCKWSYWPDGLDAWFPLACPPSGLVFKIISFPEHQAFIDSPHDPENDFIQGWNACLDNIKELNQ